MNGSVSDQVAAAGWLPEGFVGEWLPFVLATWEGFTLANDVTEEEQISGIFRKQLKKRARHSDQHNWIILDELAVRDDAGVIIGYPDLPVLHLDNPDTDSAFILECKRLNITFPKGGFKHNADDYVDDGMMRFVTGKYSRAVCEAGMLGYVMNGNTTGAQRNIVKTIRSRSAKLRVAVGGDYSLSKLLGNTPPHGETKHQLADGRKFVLYHLLVPIRRIAA